MGRSDVVFEFFRLFKLIATFTTLVRLLLLVNFLDVLIQMPFSRDIGCTCVVVHISVFNLCLA